MMMARVKMFLPNDANSPNATAGAPDETGALAITYWFCVVDYDGMHSGRTTDLLLSQQLAESISFHLIPRIVLHRF
jgi:hypothetical protein